MTPVLWIVGTSDQDHDESKAALELWRTTVTDFNSLNFMLRYDICIARSLFAHRSCSIENLGKNNKVER